MRESSISLYLPVTLGREFLPYTDQIACLRLWPAVHCATMIRLAGVPMRSVSLILLLAAATFLSGCVVVRTTATVAGAAISTTAVVAGAAVKGTARDVGSIGEDDDEAD